MARVVTTAQTRGSIFKLTNETLRAHAHAARHIPITNSCHRLDMHNMLVFLDTIYLNDLSRVKQLPLLFESFCIRVSH